MFDYVYSLFVQEDFFCLFVWMNWIEFTKCMEYIYSSCIYSENIYSFLSLKQYYYEAFVTGLQHVKSLYLQIQNKTFKNM